MKVFSTPLLRMDVRCDAAYSDCQTSQIINISRPAGALDQVAAHDTFSGHSLYANLCALKHIP